MNKLLSVAFAAALCASMATAGFADEYHMYLYDQELPVDSETELAAPEPKTDNAPTPAGYGVDEIANSNANANPGTGR